MSYDGGKAMELGAEGNYIKEVQMSQGSELMGKASRDSQRVGKPRLYACFTSFSPHGLLRLLSPACLSD